MSQLPITIHPDPILRQKCESVSEITPELIQVLDNMTETMYAAPGIGLAAPQVGLNCRVVVIDVGEDEEERRPAKLYRLINPVITAREGLDDSEEGCLSVPGIRETIKRSVYVQAKALDEKGHEITIETDGILAICLQHEIDHLDGTLFIDHLSHLKKQLVKARYKKLQQQK